MANVDLSAYEGREQAYVKHCLLQEYLPEWGYKIGSSWDTLAYVDGFAGPWGVQTQDCSDSSFGVAFEALHKCRLGLRDKWKRDVTVRCILVEKKKSAFKLLEEFASSKAASDVKIHPINGDFIETIPAITQILNLDPKTFKFVLLDPTGWADIPMEKIKPLLASRSTEVLVNLMTKHITRFLDEHDRALSYHNLFGRDGVLQALQELPKGSKERTEQAVREYCRSLKVLCGFKYVSTAVILEPDMESVRYFLVFATNHHKGVEVFKKAEMKAAGIQEAVRTDAQVRRTRQAEIMFDNFAPKSRTTTQLRARYIALAKEKVLQDLLNSGAEGIPYRSLYCEAMGFGLVQPDDLLSWIRGWEPHVKIVLEKKTSRTPSVDAHDSIIVVDRHALRTSS